MNLPLKARTTPTFIILNLSAIQVTACSLVIAGERRPLVLEDVEHRHQLRDHHHLAHPLRQVQQLEQASLPPHCVVGRDQIAQPARVDVIDGCKVQKDLSPAFPSDVSDLPAELPTSRADGNIAAEVEDGYPVHLTLSYN